MKRFVATALALVLPAVALAQGAKPAAAPAGPQGVLFDKVVAAIGDEAITLQEVQQRASSARNPLAEVIAGTPGAEGNAGLQAALDDLVAERLILGEAKKLEISIPDNEVDRHVKGIMEQNGWTDSDLENAIKMLGFRDVPAYRDHARRELTKSQVIRVKVGSKVRITDREVDEEFNRQFRGGKEEEEIHLWHIAFLIPEEVDVPGLRAILAKAEEVQAMAAEGKRDFEDLAREFGQDGSAPRGGDIGWIPRGRLQPGFEAAAFALKDGEVSRVVQSQMGFHVLRVSERRWVPIKDPEDAKRRIRYELSERALDKLYREWVKELKANGSVTIKGL